MKNRTEERERSHRSNLSGEPLRLWDSDADDALGDGAGPETESVNGHEVKRSASAGFDEHVCLACLETRPAREAFEAFPCSGGEA